MSRLRMAVIGVGHLGKEHARILAGLPEVELIGIADVNQDQAQLVARSVGAHAFSDHRQLMPRLDAAVIAVPTTQHYSLALDFLNQGIPILVEKPLALNLAQADELVELSQTRRTILQVGHIERFNPAFIDLASRPLQPKLILSERFGPFTGRSTDIGVVLDLMIHDLDVMLALVSSPVQTVQSVGLSLFGGMEDVAHARLVFANGCLGTVTASRASPVAQRRMQIWGPEGFASLDFADRKLTLIQPSAEIRQSGLDPSRLDAASRTMLKEQLFGRHLQVLEIEPRAGDALTAELKHFVHCVITGAKPKVSGEEGRNAIALATRILESMQFHSWQKQTAEPDHTIPWPAPFGQLFSPIEAKSAA
jgi:predicted dehydrogenase